MESIHENDLTTVEPVRPVAPYLGGKRNLASRVVRLIEQIPHACYAEPFVGMGGVFFRRRKRPRAEVINDYSRDVSTLFRILQRHFVPFVDMIRWQLTTRAEFERLVKVDPTTLTDLQRAARFLYLQRTAFGGRVSGRNFGVAPDRPGRFDVTMLVPMLEDVHARLSGVVIECLDFEAFIKRYDRPTTLFYLDPPYWGCERDYGDGFQPSDFRRLQVALSAIEGRFIMSLNDTPEVRDIFGSLKLIDVETTYTVAKAGSKRAAELIITNAPFA